MLKDLQAKKSLTYGHVGDDANIPLKLYFLGSEENKHGQEFTFEVDKELVLWSRERGDYTVGVTVHVEVQFFKGDLSPLLAVFAGRYNAVVFADAIQELCEPDGPVFLPVEFDLTQRSEEIRTQFTDVLRFRAERLRDDKEKLASIGGVRLQTSKAWDRYLQTMKGELTMVVVKYKDAYVRIAEDGMFGFRGRTDNAEFVRDLVYELKRLGIMP